MELIALWKIFLRRWWLIVLPALVALALTIPDLMAPPAVSGGWTTTIFLTAAQPPEADDLSTYEDTAYYPWLASEYVVNGLVDWSKTSSFAREISLLLAEEGLAIDPGAIRGAIAADNARSVMQLFISWPDAAELEALAGAAVEVLQTRNQTYFPQFATRPADVVPFDTVAIAPVAPPLTSRFRPLLKIAIGLLAGLGLAALVEYLDDSIYNREDVEALDLEVISVIPRYRGG